MIPTDMPTRDPSTGPSIDPTAAPSKAPTKSSQSDIENEGSAADSATIMVTDDTIIGAMVIMTVVLICGCFCILLGIIFVLRRKEIKRQHQQIVLQMTGHNV